MYCTEKLAERRINVMGKPTAKGWIAQNNRRYFKINGKYKLASRLIMEEHLGRPLGRNKVVHHVNQNTLDDRIENLRIMTQHDHRSFHGTGKSRSEQQLSEAVRKKKSISMKAAWARGVFDRRVLSSEVRNRMSEAKKKEWREGRHSNQFTDEVRNKMSASRKLRGDISEETRQKMSAATKSLWDKGIYSRQPSNETNEKRSETMRRRWAEGVFADRGK
jgi:hypothetical protein